MLSARIMVGDAIARLRELSDGSVRTCVTSPPYWGLRDYGNNGQLGLESTPQEFVENLCRVFDEVRRVLADDGTVWVNLGDSYFPHGGSRGNKTPAGDSLRGRKNEYQPAPKLNPGNANLKQKDLVGIPWRFAFAMQDRGWYLRQDIIWAKPNPMPESVTDRCTKAHEYVFLLTKSPRYYYDQESVKEELAESTTRIHSSVGVRARGNGGDWKQDSVGNGHSGLINGTLRDGKRNRRSVWTITTKPFKGAHFAVMPEALVEPCVLAGSAAGDTVLDPFAGSGTVGVVAMRHGRDFVGVELNPDYAELSERRITEAIGMLGKVELC